MRILRIIPFISCSALSVATEFFSTPFQFEIESRSDITEDFYHDFLDFAEDNLLHKRADAQLQTIESILISTNKSGIIWKLLNGIAGSSSAMDNIANLAISVLDGNTTSMSGLGFNFTLNTTSLLDTVMSSGLITTVADGLLLDDNNRGQVVSLLANSLVNDVWISKILQGLGNGDKPTIQYIANAIQNSTSLNPNKQLRQRILAKFESPVTSIHEKRDNNTSGSAQAFINNLLNTVLQSNLVSGSFSDILVALNSTGVGLDIVLQGLSQTSTLYTLGSTVLSKLYASGALNKIDTNTLFQNAKKDGILGNGLESLMINPTYGPALGQVFQLLENQGVFEQVKLNLYGP